MSHISVPYLQQMKNSIENKLTWTNHLVVELLSVLQTSVHDDNNVLI